MMTQLRNVRTAWVGMVLATGAALTACQGSVPGNAAAGSGAASAPAVAVAAAGASATAGATDGAATASAAPTTVAVGAGGVAGGAANAAVTTARCRTADLGFSFGPDSGAQSVGSQGGIGVVLANKGSGSCTLHGFPGVDIVSRGGTHWSLARQARSVGTVTLKPGGKASFEITYLPFDAGDSGGSVAFKAASILVTPPGETHSATLSWNGFADVMDQSGATHPGTYVGPVVAGDGR